MNPIITPSDIPYPCVCNPAAHLVGGDVLLLLRVIDQEGSSHITVARSQDGLTDWRIEPTPLLHPSDHLHRLLAAGRGRLHRDDHGF